MPLLLGPSLLPQEREELRVGTLGGAEMMGGGGDQQLLLPSGHGGGRARGSHLLEVIEGRQGRVPVVPRHVIGAACENLVRLSGEALSECSADAAPTRSSQTRARLCKTMRNSGTGDLETACSQPHRLLPALPVGASPTIRSAAAHHGGCRRRGTRALRAHRIGDGTHRALGAAGPQGELSRRTRIAPRARVRPPVAVLVGRSVGRPFGGRAHAGGVCCASRRRRIVGHRSTAERGGQQGD